MRDDGQRLQDKCMMKPYLVDIIFVVLTVLTALLLAGTTGTVQVPSTRPAPPTAAVAKEMKQEQKKSMSEQEVEFKDISKRNIFSLSGSYQDSTPISLPDNPYVLIGVVKEGDVMKAVFRDYTDKVIKASAGQQMIDGFRLIAVDNPQVMLKRANEKKIFNIYRSDGLPVALEKHDKSIAEKKPVLVAIVQGAQKKAVFRDVNGSISFLRTGQALADGSVIMSIDARRVVIRKEKETTELSLYTETRAQIPDENIQPNKLPDKSQSAGEAAPGWRRPLSGKAGLHKTIQGDSP